MGKNIETTSLLGGYTGAARTTAYRFSPSFLKGPAFGYRDDHLGLRFWASYKAFPLLGCVQHLFWIPVTRSVEILGSGVHVPED